MKKTEKAKTFLARKFFKGMCTQTQSDYYLNFSTQILLFFSLCISLSHGERTTELSIICITKIKLDEHERGEKKKLWLIILNYRFYLWWSETFTGDGELVRERAINDMHTNFFSCCSVLSDDKMLCNVQCSYVIRQLLFCSYPRHADTHYCVSLWKISWGSHWNQFAFDVESSGKVFLAEKKFRHYH